MKTLLLLLLLGAAAWAETAEGDLTAIDPKAPSLTLSVKGRLQTYRVRPNTEIVINGVRGKFAELTTAMTAKVVTGEPQVASKITANGTPGGPGAEAAAAAAATDFERRLIGTKWIWLGRHFTFEAGGKSSGERDFSWKPVKANVISYETPDGYHGTVTFEHGLTTAKVDETIPSGAKASPALRRDKP